LITPKLQLLPETKYNLDKLVSHHNYQSFIHHRGNSKRL
jgi:hypothetical protein